MTEPENLKPSSKTGEGDPEHKTETSTTKAKDSVGSKPSTPTKDVSPRGTSGKSSAVVSSLLTAGNRSQFNGYPLLSFVQTSSQYHRTPQDSYIYYVGGNSNATNGSSTSTSRNGTNSASSSTSSVSNVVAAVAEHYQRYSSSASTSSTAIASSTSGGSLSISSSSTSTPSQTHTRAPAYSNITHLVNASSVLSSASSKGSASSKSSKGTDLSNGTRPRKKRKSTPEEPKKKPVAISTPITLSTAISSPPSSNIGNESETSEEELYCVCQSPDNGTFMFQCDICDNWYHPKCVNMRKSIAKTIDYYICPYCSPYAPESDAIQFGQYGSIQKKTKIKDENIEAISTTEKDHSSSHVDYKSVEKASQSLEQLGDVVLQMLHEVNTPTSEPNPDTPMDLKTEANNVSQGEQDSTTTTADYGSYFVQSLTARGTALRVYSIETIEADTLEESLSESLPWKQVQIPIYASNTFTEQRLTVCYGDGKGYFPSRNVESSWDTEVLQTKHKLEALLKEDYNNITFSFGLMSFYRNGSDFSGFHDSLVFSGTNSPASKLPSKIYSATLLLGNQRGVFLRNRKTDNDVHTIQLQHGSLLVIDEEVHRNYLFCVPRSTNPSVATNASTILLTFYSVDTG